MSIEPQKTETQPLWTPKEVAGYLGVCLTTVRRWRKKGLLPCVEIAPGVFRYNPEKIDKFISGKQGQ